MSNDDPIKETTEVKDYKPNGKTRIYEVVVKNIAYNKTGPKLYKSKTIKYPGHKEFFGE